jgi:hypothetical protein
MFIQEGACDGDSGSPVIRRVSGTSRGNPYFEQHYIVSTGVDCELKATIYARVTNREILTWIQKESGNIIFFKTYVKYIFKKQWFFFQILSRC